MIKKLTIGALVFGPFEDVQTLGDRYRCDGADLHFTVVGEGGVVTDWTGSLPVPPLVPPVVPQFVTMRQARLALDAAGLLDTVNTTIAAMPGPQGKAARIEWEFSSEVKRYQPLVLAIGPTLGLTALQLDALFVAAAKV